MPWLLFLLALAAGAANPFQSGSNAQLNKQLGQPVLAGVFVYASGFVCLLLLQLLRRHTLVPEAPVAGVSWWAWLGGLISVVPTMVGLTIAQKMGAGIFTGCSLTASLITSVLLDQFGLVGFRQHSASPARLAGCGLLIAGIWLVARF
jgi:bacterial/archaeal transporter family-2 protein